jgi:pSer/pThr/pTyr-binding forkhead associated (FHA) protein
MAGRGVVALLTLPILFRAWRRPRVVNRIQGPGLEVISPSERRDFIPLEERFQALDFLTKISTVGSLRLSANLNKVTLSIRKYGYLMEDKNFRNALLVNRRRVRRTLLRDGDVLDLGDLTLLYRDTRLAQVIRHSSVTPSDRKAQIKFQRLRGPIRKGTPMLVMEGLPNRIFYLTKNKVFIGRSETNDLVIKSRAVYYRHAKIERVGGRYKIQDLSILGNTFVNNRRVEQRFLKEGDEISIESYRFRFQVASKAMRERPPTQEAAAEETEDVAPESASLVESGDGGDDAEENPTL